MTRSEPATVSTYPHGVIPAVSSVQLSPATEVCTSPDRGVSWSGGPCGGSNGLTPMPNEPKYGCRATNLPWRISPTVYLWQFALLVIDTDTSGSSLLTRTRLTSDPGR